MVADCLDNREIFAYCIGLTQEGEIRARILIIRALRVPISVTSPSTLPKLWSAVF